MTLEGQSQQLSEMAVRGTAAAVVTECARKMSLTRADPLSLVPDPPVYVQPMFTPSAVLQHSDNLVGQLTDETSE